MNLIGEGATSSATKEVEIKGADLTPLTGDEYAQAAQYLDALYAACPDNLNGMKCKQSICKDRYISICREINNTILVGP